MPSVLESDEKRKQRLMQEEIDRQRTAVAPPQLKAVTLNSPPQSEPVPTNEEQQKAGMIALQTAYQRGFEQSRVEHYLAGFFGACIIVGGGYLGYRGVKWAWSSASCGSVKVPKPMPVPSLPLPIN